MWRAMSSGVALHWTWRKPSWRASSHGARFLQRACPCSFFSPARVLAGPLPSACASSASIWRSMDFN
eukprot:1642504-Rhodomonas_salina.1